RRQRPAATGRPRFVRRAPRAGLPGEIPLGAIAQAAVLDRGRGPPLLKLQFPAGSSVSGRQAFPRCRRAWAVPLCASVTPTVALLCLLKPAFMTSHKYNPRFHPSNSYLFLQNTVVL